MDTEMLIFGDTVPTESNYEEFSTGNINALISADLLNIMTSADLRFFNLEVPLSDVKKPIPKCGPNLIAPTSTIEGIKALKPSLIGLANNHTLDQDEEGLFSTFRVLEENDIDYVGAGVNLNEAKNPYIFCKNGKKIGLYACAEHEFTIAENNMAGANPFDALESLDHIAELKKKCDYVIVIYHGGKEYYRYPSPNLKKVCRKMADKGADLVVCQHSHCIGCKEEYNGAVIVYGQGNFLFDYIESEYWDTSLVIKANFGDSLNVLYIPICRNNNGVRLANPSESEEILGEFLKRSNEILDDSFIEDSYEKFSLEMVKNYFCIFSMNHKEELSDEIIAQFKEGEYSSSIILAMQNAIKCEAHNELFFTALKKLSEEKV